MVIASISIESVMNDSLVAKNDLIFLHPPFKYLLCGSNSNLK